MWELILGFLLVGYVILIFVGFVFITYGMFNLTSNKIPAKVANDAAAAYVRLKPTNTAYTADMQKIELADIPKLDIDIEGGQSIMQLSDTNIAVAKVTLISLWIFIVIGIMFGIAMLI